ncbi:hypothetical protein LNQ81_02950 [Myroides sp. M-43]|uniref:hypothetical protein n=1 Tax=Myroides oncorhynchi TaxID=2893756 RepID=UPI001E2DF860|nr:hypothetical protein [Myroides oncorhynchi]MCC9041661.1 hypothetical protein [Myroides oncorhynchi]
MKNMSLVVVMLITVLLASCSKEDMPANDRDINVQYTGTSVENRSEKEYTNFYFTVKSKVKTPMEGYVEAITTMNEKLKTERFSLSLGETKEISIKKEGVIVSKDYIKSYKVYAIPVNLNPAFPNKGIPGFMNNPIPNLPVRWRESK